MQNILQLTRAVNSQHIGVIWNCMYFCRSRHVQVQAVCKLFFDWTKHSVSRSKVL